MERIGTTYQRLFEVRLLHHYWLDEGATVFDRLPDPNKRTTRLLAYDGQTLLRVRPSPSTEQLLTSFQALFRPTPLGFVVVVPASETVPTTHSLDFVASVTSAGFYEHTALTLRVQRVYELPNPADGRTYRYKENVPVLSNLTGAKRTDNGVTSLFLSREIPAPSADDGVEALVLSGGALLQLTSDGPAPATQQLAAKATDHPVYVHQGDPPPITPPAGLSGAPARGVALSPDVPDDVFAVISLSAVRADDDDFSFADGAGTPKTPAPVYQIRFKNRSTVWTYLDKTTGAPLSATPAPLPLTFFGNAGTKPKPSSGLVKPQLAGTTITQLISEIYV